MGNWKAEYLEILRGDDTLCLPSIKVAEVARLLGIEPHLIRNRRSWDKKLREAEREIASVHAGKRRADALARKAAGIEAAEAEELEAEELPWILERYLEVYRLLDDRVAAVKRMQEEGVEITLDDVLCGMQEYQTFDRAMKEIWREGVIEAEDTLRRDARAGKGAPRAMYLKGNMPEKYGNKLRIELPGAPELEEGDERLVKTLKDAHIEGGRPITHPRVVEEPQDVVEGEFEEVPS